jgi:hypothetical protein
MWASSDGGRSWQRGDTIAVHGVTNPLTMAANSDGFVATEYMRGLVWFSSDGLRWEPADGTEGIDIVKGGSDRFLGRTMEPNRLLISGDGVAWFPAAEPASLSLWGGPFGFVRVQEGIDGEPVYAFSSDSYTWLETDIQPPDDRSDGIRISVAIGEHSVAIVQADSDDVITVHLGVADERANLR